MSLGKLGGLEVLQVIESVSRERSIPKEHLIKALEEALRVAAKKKFGYDHHVKAKIDRNTGEIDLFKETLVVANEDEWNRRKEEDEDEDENLSLILLEDAKLKSADIAVGDIISEPLPRLDLGRIIAQSAKQVISARVKEIERTIQYEEFKGRVGEIVSGVVEKLERGNIIVRIGSAEAMLYKNHLIRGDHYKLGDRVRAYLVELDQNSRGPQIILSRTHNQFLVKLFSQEVPEIYDNIIQIKAVSRDPGSRAKMAVFSSDSSIDPVGSCVGMRGIRVQSVISELKGEKIDIINWTSDTGAFIISALSPATISKVIVYEDQGRAEVAVPEDQQSVAIGRQGQNVRLASEMIGWRIDILTEEKESKRRQEEFNAVTERFMVNLDLEEMLAQLLASEGFGSIQELAAADVGSLSEIEGLDEAIAEELISRAQKYESDNLSSEEVAISEESSYKSLSNISEIDNALVLKLEEKEIKNLIDLAELSREDFLDLVPDSGLNQEVIDKIIMEARKISGMI